MRRNGPIYKLQHFITNKILQYLVYNITKDIVHTYDIPASGWNLATSGKLSQIIYAKYEMNIWMITCS
jgi:hypothetical protein